VDEGEEPEDAAIRELGEETGLIAGNIRDLGMIYGDTAFGSGPVRVFMAETVDGSSSTRRDKHEPIRGFALVPLAQIRSDSLLQDAHSLAAFALAEPRLALEDRDSP